MKLKLIPGGLSDALDPIVDTKSANRRIILWDEVYFVQRDRVEGAAQAPDRLDLRIVDGVGDASSV